MFYIKCYNHMEQIQYYLTNVVCYQKDSEQFYLFYPNKLFVCLIVNCKTLYILILPYIELFYIHML